MITDSKIDSIIDREYQDFILTEYDEFSKNYESYPSDELNFQLNFDEYVRQLPDSEIADWVYREVKDFDDRDEDKAVEAIRKQISLTTDRILTREHKNLMWSLCNA